MPNGMIGQMQGGGPGQRPGMGGGPGQRPQRPGMGSRPEQQLGDGTYPRNQEDVANFITDIMRGLYDEKQFDQIVQALKGGDPIEMVGRTAAMLILTILQRRKQQTGGRPHKQLVIRGLHKAIMELADIAKMAGIAELNEEQLKESAMIAGQAVENAMSGEGGQQGPPQQQSQQGPPPGIGGPPVAQGSPQQPGMGGI